MDWKRFRRRLRTAWVTGGLAFTGWMIWSMQAHGVTAAVRVSSASVAVTEADGATLMLPTAVTTDHPAVVFLPGGLVAPTAYLPFVRSLAEAGWPVALVRLPWRGAMISSAEGEIWRRVTGVRARWGATRPIVLAGHSLGAAVSTRFANRHPSDLAGLLLIGTTHPRSDDLSSLTIPVLKVSGTRDCVADLADSQANASKLPPQTAWTTIVGANHAQFGYYGSQLGDCAATISRQEQQRQLQEEVLRWLASVEPRSSR